MKGGDTMKKLINSALAAGAMLLNTTGFVLAQVEDKVLDLTEPSEGIGDIGTLISQGLRMAMIIAGILTFAYLIWGGIQWITSGGDKAAYEEARGRITAALIGLGIVAAAWAVMWIIGNFFGINVLQGITWPTAGGPA